jgi:TonB family protein
MLTILLSAASLPSLLNMPLNDVDYPSMAVADKRSGTVRSVVTVGPDGRVRNCAIVNSSGSRDIDDITCKAFIARAHYKPATNDQGIPCFGVVASKSRWITTGPSTPKVDYSDIELVIRPVAGLKLPLSIGVTLSADAAGRVTACETIDKNAPMLHRVACDQAKRLSPLPIVHDDQGQPVPFVRNAAILFKADAPKT